MKRFAIAGREIGPNCPCFIIAEAGVNHNGDVALARRLIDAAAEAGVDAVKFQTFRTEKLVTRTAHKAPYQRLTTGGGDGQFEMLKALELSAEAHRDLVRYSRQRGVVFLSTPFDEESVDLLDSLGVPAFKTGSGELTNLPLLRRIAALGKPMIISTGMSGMDDVATALEAVREAGCCDAALLHCVSGYPADPASANLRAMDCMMREFDVPIGFSDHTPGVAVTLAAVALGGCIVEKHFTLDRTLPGPDQAASLEPGELVEMVRGIRIVEAALGDGVKRPRDEELPIAAAARRSVVAARDIPAGAELSNEDLELRRPGIGLAPALLPGLIGRRTTEDIAAGTLICWDQLEAASPNGKDE